MMNSVKPLTPLAHKATLPLQHAYTLCSYSPSCNYIPVAGISGRANLRSAELHDMLVPSRQEHSLADGVSTLQPQPSGTCFHHNSAHHPLVVDSVELG